MRFWWVLHGWCYLKYAAYVVFLVRDKHHMWHNLVLCRSEYSIAPIHLPIKEILWHNRFWGKFNLILVLLGIFLDTYLRRSLNGYTQRLNVKLEEEEKTKCHIVFLTTPSVPNYGSFRQCATCCSKGGITTNTSHSVFLYIDVVLTCDLICNCIIRMGPV